MVFSAQSYLELAGRHWRRAHPRSKKLKKPLAPKVPINIERDYERELVKYCEAIDRAMKAILLPRLPGIFGDQQDLRPTEHRADAGPDDIHKLFKDVDIRIEQDFTEEQIKHLARRQGISVAKFNADQIKRNAKRAIGVDVILGDAYLANELAVFEVFNITLITSIKDDTLAKMEGKVMADLQQGRRAEVVAKEIEEYIDPSVGNTRARANLIARDQISKLNGQLNELRQTDLGITRYRWRTSGDNRVRDSHAEKNGEIFSWDDPPSDTGHPGEDFQCRCVAEPVFEDVIPGFDK